LYHAGNKFPVPKSAENLSSYKSKIQIKIMKRHNDQKINEVLGDMIKDLRLKPKLNQTKIKEVWAEMMGPQIDRYTKKITVQNTKVVVTIESSPLRQELSYGKDKILKNLNEALGEAYLTEIVIR
jgi:predicted nucleic acid-binding Zn ribbon protein